MNVSKNAQRTLHALAQGGHIAVEKDERGKIIEVRCFTREGHVLSSCSMTIFKQLRKHRMIRSSGGAPYRVTREGLEAVRAQVDNR